MNPQTDILETNRLVLRKLTLQDSSFIIELLNTPDWLKYIGERYVKNEEQAIAYLENGPLKSYHENGYGLWLVETKVDKRKIGMCGILNRPILEHPDIGYAFLPEFTGQGYAVEIAEAVMAYAFTSLKVTTLLAITLPENERSINVLEKIGMRCVKRFHFAGNDDELLLYST
jgi:RimJ/RimL family protein N-acetyltransferase